MAGLKFAFVMDPMEKVLPEKDTTFVLMLESLRRGHACWHLLPRHLRWEPGGVRFRARRVTVRREAPFFEFHETEDLSAGEVDAIWLRKDPPFDHDYYLTTLFLEAAERETVVLNRPAGVRGANEKLYALRFPEVTPKSLVTADPARARAFIEEVGGEAVLKPIDMMGGYGIFRARIGDENLPSLLEFSTEDGTRRIIVQEFIQRVYEGDKRIILLDGEPLGAVLRVPPKGEFRGNIHIGGIVRKTSLDDADRRIVAALAPSLRADGLYFVGIDVIGGLLTEVNVTSPTGVQEIDRLDGERLEERVIDFAEKRAAERRGGALR